MKGTIFSVTRAIDLMPPTITANTTPARISPTSQPRPSSAPPDNIVQLHISLVRLEHVADTERTDEDTDCVESAHELAETFHATLLETLAQVVHRAAGDVPILELLADI